MKAFWVLSLTSRLISSLISTMTLSAAALIATGGAFGAVLRSPMGEEADYALDKGGSRTSNLISKGSGNGLVDQDLPDHEFGPSYGTLMNYQLVVKIQGTYTGSMRFVFPDEYFTPQFMVDLRQNGTFETRDYKMKHEGRGDARTLDGGTYPQCDRILMYDIKNAFS
ncbi:MAG: hypothetical protein NTV34_15260, partial [Proteobacteria bacterium]|nr:hypothetical protein [Pseudomonadota bacterium]